MRITIEVTLPTISSAPAAPADMPSVISVSTMNVPAVVPTADPSAAATANIINASGARPAGAAPGCTCPPGPPESLGAQNNESGGTAQGAEAPRPPNSTPDGT